jgi:hypothetical protein
MLKDLGSDNIIRVTVMLDGKSQLKDRVSEFYPSREGVYFFVKKQSEESVIPETYPNLSQKLIDFAQKTYPYGEVIDDGNTRSYRRRQYTPGVVVFNPHHASNSADGNSLCPV